MVASRELSFHKNKNYVRKVRYVWQIQDLAGTEVYPPQPKEWAPLFIESPDEVYEPSTLQKLGLNWPFPSPECPYSTFTIQL